MATPESAPPPGAARSNRAPVAALLLLAPVVSEVLYGGTRLSFIVALVPEIMIWGGGALLARELVRSRRGGWPGLVLLGLALAVAEEWVIQQTSVAPLTGLAAHAYGRVAGVNWVYCLWAVVYECVWVVLVPVQLVELLFPDRRGSAWLRRGGRLRAAFAFTAGAVLAWYSWTQRARVLVFHMPPYALPAGHLVVALAAIAALVATAWFLRTGWPAATRGAAAPTPAIVGLTVALLGLPWGALVLVGFGRWPDLPFVPVLAAGLGWVVLGGLLLRRWAGGPGWQDRHRFAAVFGAVMACMLSGFAVFGVGGALRIDWIGKGVLNVAATLWLVSVGRSVWRRTAAAKPSS